MPPSRWSQVCPAVPGGQWHLAGVTRVATGTGTAPGLATGEATPESRGYLTEWGLGSASKREVQVGFWEYLGECFWEYFSWKGLGWLKCHIDVSPGGPGSAGDTQVASGVPGVFPSPPFPWNSSIPSAHLGQQEPGRLQVPAGHGAPAQQLPAPRAELRELPAQHGHPGDTGTGH